MYLRVDWHKSKSQLKLEIGFSIADYPINLPCLLEMTTEINIIPVGSQNIIFLSHLAISGAVVVWMVS